MIAVSLNNCGSGRIGNTMGFSIEQTQTPAPFNKSVHALKTRASGAGGMYNIGNIVALGGGVTVHCTLTTQHPNLVSALWSYFFNNLETACLTLAMILFIIGGEIYHRALSNREIIDAKLVRHGDMLTGIAAVFITISQLYLGNTYLAVTAGSLLITAKLGSVIFPQNTRSVPNCSKLPLMFRYLAVASKFASLAAVGLPLLGSHTDNNLSSDLAVTAIMFLAYLIWLWADYLLITSNK